MTLPLDWTKDEYVGRPGVSPVVAALVAADVLRTTQRVLDVGCGRGTDALALASWGFRRVEGLDVNAKSLAAARRRARRLGLERRVTFTRGSALEIAERYRPASFDVVLDTLLVNNLAPDDARDYVRQVARVLRKGGLLVMHTKVYEGAVRRAEDDAPTGVLRRYFARHRAVGTHIAEGSGRRKRYVPIVVRVAKRNGRRAP